MQDHLIGYLLGALDLEEISHVERSLIADGQLQAQLEVLRLAMAPLESDRQLVDAPPGLAARTCRQIRELQNSRIA